AKGDLVVAVDGDAGGVRVGEDEGVLPVLRLEEEEDALLLEEAADEVEIGLVVLDHVLPGRVAAREGGANLRAALFQDLLDDLRNLQRLEDPALSHLAQRPQLRHHPEAELAAMLSRPGLPGLHAGDDAVDVPDTLVEVDPELGLLAEERRGV